MIGKRIGVDNINTEGKDDVAWFIVELDKRISSFIIDWDKVCEHILLLRLIVADFYY